MSDTSQPSAGKKPAPPYVPYPSFRTMIGGFKEHGLPARIDRSVLSSFSGITGGQLMTSLKFLDLIDDHNHPKDGLRTIVSSFGTPQWASALSELLRLAYAPIFQLDLKSASPSQFNERFKTSYPGENSTLRKNLTFFLSAAKEAEIEISPYITKNKKPRSGPTKRRAKVNGQKADAEQKPATGTPLTPPADQDRNRHPKSIVNQLLDKFPAFNPEWGAELQAKWFDGYQRLLAMGEK